MLGSVQFTAEGIRFDGYPFPPASVYPSGLLPYSDIAEVNPQAAPPEVRTREGEILFVAAPDREKLIAAAEAHGIPNIRRYDVWDLILEPFLDTEFDVAHKVQTMARLKANGVSRTECEALREQVAAAIHAYNFDSMLWEWVHLGLFDLLLALMGELAGPQHALSAEDFAAFYQRSMTIACGASTIEP